MVMFFDGDGMLSKNPAFFGAPIGLPRVKFTRSKLRIFLGATTPDQRFYVSDISHLVPDMCHVSQLDLTLKNGDEWDIHGDMNGRYSQLLPSGND